MAVLGRLKIAANQRLDLPDIVAFDTYSASDWANFLTAMVGSSPYVVKGFEIFQPNTLIGNPATTISVVIDSSSLWWPEGAEGSFFVALPGAASKSATLITNSTNYVEMDLTLLSGAADARALWDPGANGGAGGEFIQVVDTENFLDVTVTRNNTGFSSNKVPIAKIVVNASNIVISVTDCRPLIFRLGTGGNSPDPLNSYQWKDDPIAYARVDTPVTMTSPLEPNVFRGADKNFQSFKEWMDAIMSRLKEIDGGAKWFRSSGATGGGALSLSNLFLDSQAGHSIVPDGKITLAWSKANDSIFRSQNAVGYSAALGWNTNFGQLTWQLGGTFTSSSDRSYSSYPFAVSVTDGDNLYLQLQRDATLNGDPVVHFENTSGTTASCSSVAAGSFIGIACGDYIRKESGDIFQYYQVLELRVNFANAFTNGGVDGTVANATVQYLVLSTHDGPIVTTDEPFRFFRKNYAQSDLVVSQLGALDTSAYWIGKCTSPMFYLRDYGDMKPGEETEVLDEDAGDINEGSTDLLLDRAYDSVYDPTLGYKLKAGGTTTLLTIQRYLLDNTVGTPSNSDNSGAMLTYTIAAPVGVMADGDTLWVRLGNTGGPLTSGDVTNLATDNVWQILSPEFTPIRTYDNKNVFMVTRRFTAPTSGVEYLKFSDGVLLSLDGEWIDNHLSVQGDMFLKQFTQWSVPFISTTTGKLGQNNAEFNWVNNAGPDLLGELTVRNFQFSSDTLSLVNFDVIDQITARDVHAWPNIGAFTITIGNSASAIVIPGDLIVQGTETIISTANTIIADKHIELGIGNSLFGGGHSGIRIADNTLSLTVLATTITESYVDLTWTSDPGYATGQVVGLITPYAYDGVLAGDISMVYTVTVGGSPTVGEIQRTGGPGSNTFRAYTNGTATASNVNALTPGDVQSFDLLSEIHLSGSDASEPNMTSWTFEVKSTTVAADSIRTVVTPYESTPGAADYLTIPTAKHSNFSSTRIPFAGNDNVGPSGSDTTLDFSANLTWNGSQLTVGGDIVPRTDIAHDIGMIAYRWKAIHLGPGSLVGAGALVVHGDTTNTLLMRLLYNGTYGILATDANTNLQLATGANNGIKLDIAGRMSIAAGAPSTDSVVYINTGSASILSSLAQKGIFVNATLAGITTSDAIKILSHVQPVAAVTDLCGLRVANSVLLSGSSAANQYAILIEDLTVGTSNFAIRSEVASGANKWFLYGNGTAMSYFAGNVGFGQPLQASITSKITFAVSTTADGGILFGNGNSNLYRSAADTLKTDGSLIIVGTASTGILFDSGLSNLYRPIADTLKTDGNFIVGGTGGILFISGSANLYRSAADTLKTDGSLVIVGTASTGILFNSGLSNLYRPVADTIRTDGNFIVGGSLTLLGGTVVSGAFNLNYGTVITANYAVGTTDCIIPVDTTGSVVPITITLPAITAPQKGRLLIIKDVGGGCQYGNKVINLQRSGADTIDGSVGPFVMDRGHMSISLVCNGLNNWDIV